MASRKAVIIAVFSAILAIALVGSRAFADDFDQAMRLTFTQPIAIPGQVLPAGTYWFELPAHGEGTELSTLQVFDEGRKRVLATVHTGTEEIVKPSGRVILTLADRSPKEQALLTLVYPGKTDGHQFELVYSDQEKRQFSEFPKTTMKVDEKGNMQRIAANGEDLH